MKPLMLLLAACTFAQAATPTMWIKDARGRIPLRIDTIDAQVTITGDVAETLLTLRFRNETSRIQEGEFVMPLPVGSTVSQYALEVNGQLRNGVSVEKEQARHAYETIKRAMIDPGIIEREAGNTYRTKVFPIPARGTKLVRIGYIEHLHAVDGKLRYTLPTDYPGTINAFSCTIRHHQEISIQAGDLPFTPSATGIHTARSANSKLPPSIIVGTTPLAGDTMTVEKHDSVSYFSLNFAPPADAVEKPRHKPAHINIIWDASGSAAQRPVQRELELLGAYFKQLGNTRVSLQILRNTLKDAGEFNIDKGNWDKLRKTLENTFHDGSTAYHLIKESQHDAPLTLVFTDGNNAGDLSINDRQSTIIFHTAENARLRLHTGAGQVQAIHILHTPIEKALHALTHTRYIITDIDSTNLGILPGLRNGRYQLLGTCRETPSSFSITFTNGNGETIRHHLRSHQVKQVNNSSLVKRLWAQRKLSQLETIPDSKEQIVSHCRQYGLVSDFTSLIVLERFQDYVRFDIPPPEPDLLAKWERQRTTKQSGQPARDELLLRLKQQWNFKLAWHQRDFSWLSEELLAAHQQAGIWLDAISKVFDKKDLDPQAYGVIETWHQQAQKLAVSQGDNKNKEDYRRWLNTQHQLITQWNELPNKPPKLAPGQKLAVSVRGLVNNPDIYRSDQPLTLKQSIALAGGKFPLGSLQYVSLYRNAHALTYNLHSMHYKDVPLLPGDMVVVERDRSYYDADWDPFSSGETQPKPSPAHAPAVTQRPPRYADRGGADDDPFGGTRLPNKPAETVIRIQAVTTTTVNPDALKGFAEELNNGTDPATAYQKLKGKHVYPPGFYIRVARILARHNQQELAHQVLTNITEGSARTLASRRELAYWLGELGFWKAALVELTALRNDYPQDAQARLDLIRYQQRQNPAVNPATSYNFSVNHFPKDVDLGYNTLAVTERNAYAKTHYDQLSENLISDLRCVIYCSDPTVQFNTRIIEPGGTETRKWHNSRQGGRLFTAPGVQEYMLKRAMPGNYSIECASQHPTTVQIAIYSHWGGPNQSCEWTTVQLDGKGYTKAASYDLSWKE
ncbi:MAG: hypothetical protein H7A51_12455 [Akkermansiaceae bacterium]|nr:hypothetical protein [Akkermansiaceae bacterium]